MIFTDVKFLREFEHEEIKYARCDLCGYLEKAVERKTDDGLIGYFIPEGWSRDLLMRCDLCPQCYGRYKNNDR